MGSKTLLRKLVAVMLLVVAVSSLGLTAGAEVVTVYSVDADVIATRWTLEHKSDDIMTNIIQYTTIGTSIGSYVYDTGNVDMVIFRNSPTNLVKTYSYTNVYQYHESYTNSGDALQTGDSVSNVYISDVSYGYVKYTVSNN